VTLPAGLIAELSHAGQVRSIDEDLFPEGSELANYLQLDEIQVSQLESEWEGLRQRIRELEAKSAHTQETPDGCFEVVIPELHTGIDSLGDEFRSSASRLVGTNRAEIIIAAAQVDALLGGFAGGRKMSVRAEETGDGNWRYHTVEDSPRGRRIYVGETVPDAIRRVTGDLQMADTVE
jgi:hypothetical protein